MQSVTITQKIDILRRRIGVLYQSVDRVAEHELLQRAFEELQLAIEELQTTEEELRGWQQNLLISLDQIKQDCLRYQDLFEHAPAGYLVTSLDATIRQANQASQQLLGAPEKFLVGRSLALFLPTGERQLFRERVLKLPNRAVPLRWSLRMGPWKGEAQPIDATVALIQGQGRPSGLRWLLQTGKHHADEPVPLP
jgi:PAS domain S-box-containing protein